MQIDTNVFKKNLKNYLYKINKLNYKINAKIDVPIKKSSTMVAPDHINGLSATDLVIR